MKNAISKLSVAAALFFSFSSPAVAQHNIYLKVKSLTPYHLPDTLFAAGNFNNWEPSTTPFTFSAADTSWSLQLKNIKQDVLEFKFTRGSWSKVEAAGKGQDIQNRLVHVISDTTVNYTIAAWKDDFASVSKRHTASVHVSIIDAAFYLPQLNRERRLWIYLPEGYATSKKHYPVLYMQDGQNIFDELTSGFGEWGVDEFLDSMQFKNKNACIVVGIDNGAKRVNEYNPYDNEKFGKGEGKEYIEFLAKTLKPFIDNKYRTLPGRENTIIAGSSIGGLISYYAILAYPNVFGKAGIFSPSFWIAPQILSLTDSMADKSNGKFFFYIGESEGQQYVQDMINVMDKLGSVSGAIIYSAIDPYGSHNEQAWRKWFPEFYKWIMADWTNYVIKPDN
ncbi:MAG: alpha/beta hydrolase-fold protein [Ferruginibacter sp.]